MDGGLSGRHARGRINPLLWLQQDGLTRPGDGQRGPVGIPIWSLNGLNIIQLNRPASNLDALSLRQGKGCVKSQSRFPNGTEGEHAEPRMRQRHAPDPGRKPPESIHTPRPAPDLTSRSENQPDAQRKTRPRQKRDFPERHAGQHECADDRQKAERPAPDQGPVSLAPAPGLNHRQGNKREGHDRREGQIEIGFPDRQGLTESLCHQRKQSAQKNGQSRNR